MPDTEVITRLILADGRVLDQSECGYSEGKLWCYLKNVTFVEAFQLFSDPEKTKNIIFEYGIDGQFKRIVYSGFIIPEVVVKREYTIDVCMTGTDTDIKDGEVIE